jgi:uncharacterized delta-60 repeat protein
MARLNTDGTFDSTFSNGGFNIKPGSVYSSINAASLQADGKIFLGGAFGYFTSNNIKYATNRMARINSDGSFDTEFRVTGSGVSMGNIASGSIPSVFSFNQKSDKKNLVGGLISSYISDSAISTLGGLYQLNEDGSLDTNFNSGGTGFASSIYAHGIGQISTIATYSDGRILVGGDYNSYNDVSGTNNLGYIARLNSNGTLDTSFNPGGTGFNAGVNSIVFDNNGKILVGGAFTSYNTVALGTTSVKYITRLNSDGSLDTSFNSGGTGPNAVVLAVYLLPDGKILIGGSFTNYNTSGERPL